MEKQCFKCGEAKARDEFYKHPAMADGLLGKCKECTKADAKATRRERIEYYREYDRTRASLPHRASARKEYALGSGKEGQSAAKRRYFERNPSKRAAHNKLNAAVRDGKMTKPNECEQCGDSGRIHGHHDDYSKPLDVRWLCASCHAAVHKAVREPHPETGRLYNRYE